MKSIPGRTASISLRVPRARTVAMVMASLMLATGLTAVQDATRAGATAAIGTITEIPDDQMWPSQIGGIALGSDGNMWYASRAAQRGITRMTPSGVITDFTEVGPIDRVALGPDDNMWYAAPNRIGRITPGGAYLNFALGLAADAKVEDLTRGPDGNIWFTVPGGVWVGRITLSGVVTLFDAQPSGATNVQGITSGPDGNLWVADSGGGILRVTPTGVITRFTAGITAGSVPSRIAPAPDGNLWFTESAGNRIGRITPAGVVTEFSAGISPDSYPSRIAEGPDGNLWFTELDGGRVGRVKPNGTIDEFSTGITAGSQLLAIAAGPKGTVWFSEANRKYLGRVQAVTDPGAPTIGAVTPGNGQVTVNWTPPSDYGGGPIYGYKITPYVGAVAQAATVFNSTNLTTVITGLTNGTTYTFKVAATNAAATGPQSGASAAVIPRTVPGVPTIGAVSGGKGAAQVAWTGPTSNGGLALTGYRVVPNLYGIAQPAKNVGLVASTQVTGLTNGAAYRFKVAATSPAGTGNQSAASALVIPPFSSPSAFIAQQSQDFMGRAPTAGETSAALASLNGGTKPGAYIASIRDGDDGVQNVDPLVRLYFAYFLRTPDRGGLDFWLRRRRNEVRLYAVSDQFAKSSEFKTRYGSLTNQQFVELVYQNVLGRPGDAGGIASWTGKLDTKTKTRGEVMVGFSESSEYQTKIAPSVDASVTWLSLLASRPDSTSFNSWVATLTAGPSTDADMAAALMSDPRYSARLP